MKNTLYRIFQNSGLIIVSLGLLYGGVRILQTQIPFWSLLYGIPAVSLGIAMTVISFNEIAKNRTARATEYHQIPCKVCNKMTLAPMLIDEVVCPNCQYKMARRLNIGVLLLFLLLAIPVTVHLVQQSQDIRQNAQGPVKCEAGAWDPLSCRCGAWSSWIKCSSNTAGRLCGSTPFCCQQPAAGKWNCQIAPNNK